jgi:GDP-4-dehydro-6-deoxy-D-mannose reductase
MMRAFVTGAAGFVGSHLTERLLDRGREVFGLILDRRDVGNLTDALAGAHASYLHLIEGDLLEASFLGGVVREIRPDEVYHLAAQPSVRQSTADPAGTFRINVLGTQTLLEAVREDSGRPRVLYVGSAEAYGESAGLGGPLTEERPLLPVTPYGSSKAAAEQVACRYGAEYGLAVVRVRPFPHTGPRHAPNFVYPDLARQLCEMRAGRCPPRLLVGNLEVRRDLSDVRDVVAAYVLALERGEPGAVYNVCCGRTTSVREVLDLLIGLSGVTVEVAVQTDRLRSHELEVLSGSAQALRTRTGWAPLISLETTLRDLLFYWQARCGAMERG